MATHSRILTWESHVQRSLAGYSPRGCKESDTTMHTCMYACMQYEREGLLFLLLFFFLADTSGLWDLSSPVSD